MGDADRSAPHKIDENMWRNREHMEEIVFLLERSRWPPAVMHLMHIPMHYIWFTIYGLWCGDLISWFWIILVASIFHKIFWVFCVQLKQQSTPEAAELAIFFDQLKVKFQQTLNALASFQAKNSERVFNTGCLFPSLCVAHVTDAVHWCWGRRCRLVLDKCWSFVIYWKICKMSIMGRK